MQNPTFETIYKLIEDNTEQKSHVDPAYAGREHTLFHILTWRELDNIVFPEVKWLIADLIPAGCVVLIAAPSGEKKSWTALEMARCVASGTSFAGHFETHRTNVLYIEQESPQSDIQRRGRQLGINLIEDGIYFLSQDALSLNDQRVTDELLVFAQNNKIGLVFIDTLRSVAGGIKEEKAEEIRAFFARFKAWKDKGITVVVLDHCRKPQRWEGGQHPKKDQILGSQDKVAAVEVVHMIRSEQRSEEIFFYPIKSKVSREPPAFKLLLIFSTQEGAERAVMSYGSEIEAKKMKSEEAKHLIAAYLRETGEKKTSKNIQDALQGDAGKTAIEDALREMRSDGSIQSQKDGKAYQYWIPSDDQEPDDFPNEDLGSLFLSIK